VLTDVVYILSKADRKTKQDSNVLVKTSSKSAHPGWFHSTAD